MELWSTLVAEGASYIKNNIFYGQISTFLQYDILKHRENNKKNYQLIITIVANTQW